MSSENAKNANENSFSFNQTLILELVKQATISLSTVQQIINIFYASNINNNIIENDLGGNNNFDHQNKHIFEEGKGLLKQTTRVLSQMENGNSQDGVTTTQVTSVNGGNIINTRNIQRSEHSLNNNNNIISGNASFDKNTTLQELIDANGGNTNMNRIETRNCTCMDLNINNNVIIEEWKNTNMNDDCKSTDNSGSNEQSEWIIAGFKKYYYNKTKLNNMDKKNKNTSSTFTIKSNNIKDELTYKYRVSKYTYLYCSNCDNYGHTKGKCKFGLNNGKQLKEHLHNNNCTDNSSINNNSIDDHTNNICIENNNNEENNNQHTTNDKKDDEDVIIILPTNKDDDYATTPKTTSSNATTANKDSELLFQNCNISSNTTTITNNEEKKDIINAQQYNTFNVNAFEKLIEEKDENELCGVKLTTETIESVLQSIESQCPNYRQDRYLFRTYLLLLVHKRADTNEHPITYELLNRIKNYAVDSGLLLGSGEQDFGGRIMSSSH